MVGLRSFFAAVGMLYVVPAHAFAEPNLFPAAVISAGGEASFAERLREPPLWVTPPSANAPERIRLLIGGHTVASWSIRLDRTPEGRWTGYFREHTGRHLGGVKRFEVTGADVAELIRLIDDAGLWRVYPQFWVSDDGPNEICIDGITVVFERSSASGYGYSEGNAQCTMGQNQKAVAAKMMQMAGRADMEMLLH